MFGRSCCFQGPLNAVIVTPGGNVTKFPDQEVCRSRLKY